MKEKRLLFTELTADESVSVSGGSTNVSFDLNTYLFILGTAIVFGNPGGLTPSEIEFAWENALVFGDQNQGSQNQGHQKKRKNRR